jgi:predicted RNase H-like HicB family nuclease
MRMQYAVILEKEPQSDWGAYVPDLPGCVATGKTREEAERLIREAIEFHLRGMREDGDPIPPPTSTAVTVEVAA